MSDEQIRDEDGEFVFDDEGNVTFDESYTTAQVEADFLLDEEGELILDELGEPIIIQEYEVVDDSDEDLSDWLVKRLTLKRKDSERWVQFAEAIQELWEYYFFPAFEAMENLRSIYTADDATLITSMAELGDYFRDDYGVEEDRILQILWRRLEVVQKGTEGIITTAMKRKFLGFNVKWEPLWHSKAEDYGTEFFTADYITLQGWDFDDFWLTSRGKISLVSKTLPFGEGSLEDFLAAVDEEVERIRPAHIHYMGTTLASDTMELQMGFGAHVATAPTTYIGMNE